MRIYSINNIPNDKNLTFTSLKIQNPKKWPKEELDLLENSPEVKKLVEAGEKEGVDIIAEYYKSHSMYSPNIIHLKNSYNHTFGYYSASSFKYDLFKAYPFLFEIKEKGLQTKLSKNKNNALDFTKKICKSLKDYAKNKFLKLENIPKK